MKELDHFGLASLHLVEPADAGAGEAERHLAPIVRRRFQARWCSTKGMTGNVPRTQS